MWWKHQRNTQPMLRKRDGPCGICGLCPGPKGGRDMHDHSLADSKLGLPLPQASPSWLFGESRASCRPVGAAVSACFVSNLFML